MRAKSFLLATSILGVMAGAAFAQQPIPMSQSLPPLPAVGAPGPIGLPATAQPVMVRPMNNESQPAAGVPAMPPAQPAGGFGATPPAPGSDDPAQRMNLDNSASYSAKMQADGRARLGQMTGVAGPAATGPAGLPTAPIASQSDLEALTKIQRNISILDAQVKEAELAVKLWHTLYNNADAKEWREEEKKTKAEAAKAEVATPAVPDVRALQAPTFSADPVVLEVFGNRARLLMPGNGELVVRAGQVLPEGKVISVGLSGVVFERDGRRQTFGFGTSIPTGQSPNGAPPSAAFARPISR